MKKNNLFKKTKNKIAMLLLLFCVFFASNATAQKILTWTAATDNTWATAGNWSQTGTTFNPTGTTAVSTAVVTVASTTDLTTGDTVIGAGIPANTTITVNSGTQFTMSVNCTVALGVGTNLEFIYVSADPGAVPSSNDVAIIDNNSIASPVITGSITVRRFYIRNTVGTTAGPTFTIPFGTTFNCNSGIATFITVAGGNIVNNGTLSMTNISMTVAAVGVNFLTPVQAPASATEYGYSGSGLLTMNTPAVATNNNAVIQSSAANANTTIRILFNGTTDFTLSATNTASIVRAQPVLGTASPLIVGGAGYTHGTSMAPKNGGVLSMTARGILTISPETTINNFAAITNISSGISIFVFKVASTTTFTNRGVINILGSNAQRGGINLGIDATNVPTAIDAIITFNNHNVINIDLSNVAANQAPFMMPVNGATAGTININNFATGIINLKNSTPFSTNVGSPIRITLGGAIPNLLFTNDGSLNLSGTNVNYGGQVRSVITNNGSLTSNTTFEQFAMTNSATGSMTFANAAVSATRGVTFTIAAATNFASIGTTYTDGSGNTHVVNTNKVAGTGTSLVTTIPLGGTYPSATGTLTKTGTGAGSATIAWTAVAAAVLVASQTSALTGAVTNNGIINTATGSTNLTVISGATQSANSTIAPGGSTGKGVAKFNAATVTLDGKYNMQVAGNTAAGTDYDQITNNTVNGGFSIPGTATLDVTGLSGTATPVDIIVANGTGTISGTFNSIIGLTNGWSVNYGVAGKVQLVYAAVAATTSTWLGTNAVWTDAANWTGGTPNRNSNVVIGTTANNPVITNNININDLSIDTANLTVNALANLTVNGAITNTNGGTVTINSNANLIQTGVTNTNTGNAIVNRNSNALSLNDFTAWSSPVAAQNLLAFSPMTRTDRFNWYNEDTNRYNAVADPSTTTFAMGTGYLIRMRSNAAEHPLTETFAGQFTGVPNNGTINKAMAYGGATKGYNLVGNPYPSTIDANSLISANTAVIENSLYFWRKRNGAMGSAYAVYNLLGATTASPTSALPNGTIQVGQGFIVKAKSASNLVFTNALRTANNANQTFKTAAAQKDRLWLNLTSAAGAFSQALVGYTADATSGVDMYDAKYFGDSDVALTSAINNEEYSIQGRPAFDASDVVALNFKSDVTADYTIALNQFDGVFATGQDVYLVDGANGSETDLKAGSYTFTANAGADNNRFSLKFQKTLKVIGNDLNKNGVTVSSSNGVITVNSAKTLISKVMVFNLQGRLVAAQNNVNANATSLKALKAGQVFIVRVIGADKSVSIKKVLNK